MKGSLPVLLPYFFKWVDYEDRKGFLFLNYIFSGSG